MLVTLFCFSTGIPGGMFAPTLFTGAMIGGGLGGLAHHYWPFPTSPAGAYVLVGMGTFFAGVFRAPMTSIFMVFEVSASYVIILPVIVSNTVAYFVSRQLHPVPFFTMLARQEGFDLPSAEERRSVAILRIEDAMHAGPAPVLGPRMTVADALGFLEAKQMPYCLAHDASGGWARVTLEALQRAASEGHARSALADARVLQVTPRVYPDQPVDTAMRLLGGHPVLPVASRADPDRLVGTLTIGDVHRAYGVTG
jgi:CIC family chloride channel protein